MNILLTGYKGQLGHLLKPALSNLGRLTTVDRNAMDLSALASIVSILEQIKPDLIVNAAAYTNVDKAEKNPVEAAAVNGAAPGLMARWAAENASSMIHFSTDYVFDGSGDQPWCEDAKPNPINVYGESKNIGDKEVLASGAPNLIFRTSWVYAARGQNFMTTMLRLGKERSELRVVMDQIGAPTPAALIANATAEIIKQGKENLLALLRDKGGVVNLTPKGETSWHGFAEAIFHSAKAHGLQLRVSRVEPIHSSEYALPAPRPLNSRLALNRLRERFDISPPSWQEALTTVMKDFTGSA